MRSRPLPTLIVVALALFASALAARGAGLLAPTDQTLPPLRVTEHLVDVSVQDQIALTTVKQTFRNDTNQRLEATYVFPLPENADLTDFQMSFNGKMVEGKVLPAEEARRIYESIVRQSKDPGLIEFIGRRLLQMRVFPIEPNSDVKIEVKYQQICRPMSGMSGYHYPLRTAKTSSAGGGQAYGTVRFAVKLHSTSPLKNIWSPTHSVEIVRDGEHNAKIAYEASRGSLEDDFILLYDTADSDLGLSAITYKPHEKHPGFFVLTLTPKQLWPEQEYQPQDVVFVIDTSGSMAGDKIDQARRALKFCIDKLDERDRFSVVRFSTGFDVLFEELREATKEARSEARQWIDKFTAAGGTNINDSLVQALGMDPAPPHGDDSRPFVVVFITDGQGNQSAEDTLAAVKKAASEGARIFPFGVGHDVNTVLLDQLASGYSGKPTYVQPGEDLELVLGDFFSVISQPVLTNLKLALPEIGVTERFPATLGDLYHGQQLIIAGKFETPMTGSITLNATRGGKDIQYKWPAVSFTHTAEAQYVPAIWAGRKIAFLIDQIRMHGENDEMVGEVIALSQEYGIQTPYSSWLVNPEQQPVIVRRAMERGRGGSIFGEPGNAPGRSGGGGISGGGGGGGGGRPPAAPAAQRGAMDGAGLEIEMWVRDEAAADDELYLFEAETAAGEAAVHFAKRNAELRESRSKDADRLDQNLQLSRKLGERWYNRIGQFLVDETFTEETALTVVKFGSDAYFELAAKRPELRAGLAASANVIVIVADGKAIAVSERTGLEQFSHEERQKAGLGG